MRRTLGAVWLLVPEAILKALVCSNTVQATDSSHHRLSDKVNCDLTLRRISVLLPVGRGEKTGETFNISTFISFLVA